MNNKEYLIKVLENLVGHREMADSLLQVVKSVELGSDTIDTIAQLMKREIKAISMEGQTDKMNKGLAILEKIKKQESSAQQQEKSELDELEKMLDAM